jgi:endonuclease YncB( thermonuclease family)
MGAGLAHTNARASLPRLDPHLLVVATVIVAAVIFIVASTLGRLGIQTVDTSTGRAFPCTVVKVMDGDGPVICEEEDQSGRQVQVRLRGIEARDGDGNCRLAQGCPEMNWQEARAVLVRIAGPRMNCVSHDTYRDRVDSFCSTPSGVDIACELVKMGAAVRWPEFDRDGRLLNCITGRRS